MRGTIAEEVRDGSFSGRRHPPRGQVLERALACARDSVTNAASTARYLAVSDDVLLRKRNGNRPRPRTRPRAGGSPSRASPVEVLTRIRFRSASTPRSHGATPFAHRMRRKGTPATGLQGSSSRSAPSGGPRSGRARHPPRAPWSPVGGSASTTVKAQPRQKNRSPLCRIAPATAVQEARPPSRSPVLRQARAGGAVELGDEAGASAVKVPSAWASTSRPVSSSSNSSDLPHDLLEPRPRWCRCPSPRRTRPPRRPCAACAAACRAGSCSTGFDQGTKWAGRSRSVSTIRSGWASSGTRSRACSTPTIWSSAPR